LDVVVPTKRGGVGAVTACVATLLGAVASTAYRGPIDLAQYIALVGWAFLVPPMCIVGIWASRGWTRTANVALLVLWAVSAAFVALLDLGMRFSHG
jgi:hypothetical protein